MSDMEDNGHRQSSHSSKFYTRLEAKDYDHELEGIRAAIISLEIKMEEMSKAMTKVVDTLEKLSEMQYEIKDSKRDIKDLNARLEKLEADYEELHTSHGELASKTERNALFVGAAERVVWILVTTTIGLLYWLIRDRSGH